MKKLFALLFFFLVSAVHAQQKQVQQLAPAAFEKQMAAQKGQVIDVRTPREYKAGHIGNAVNMHLYDKDFEQRLDKLDKSKTVFVYCKVGGRSADAVEIMAAKGFKHIIELKGGTDAWTEAGKPLVQ